MTKEEAKELFRNDKDSYGKPRAIMSKISKIYDEFEKESLTIPDIRNKLSPITTLISLLEIGDLSMDDVYIKKAIKQSKISINYLSDNEIYKEDEISKH